MKCDEREEQVLLFALGETDSPEQQEFRAHLAGCPRCQGKLAETAAILAMLPMSLPATVAPTGARERVMGHHRLAVPLTARPSAAVGRPIAWVGTSPRKSLWPAILSGSIAAAITGLIFSIVLVKKDKSIDNFSEITSSQRTELEDLRRQVHADEQRLMEMGHETMFATSPALRFAMLKGSGVQPSASGRLIWEPTDRTIWFCATNLKTLPTGRTYELWLINADHQPVPAGMFNVDSHGMARMKHIMENDPGAVEVTAVTEEFAAGSAKPTMPPLLSGQVE